MLPIVKAMLKAGKVRGTLTALSGAAQMGFGFDDIVGIVEALSLADFYKSMTTYADHRVWHDVYRPKTEAGTVYLKLMVIDDVLIVSFKEVET
jgi:motility quorum-sensing regulator / GCU-specific mRNA interferase toxin